jgi:hypothetical protein
MVKKQHFYNNNIGSVKQTLIENFEDGFLFGHSENYIPVRISGSPNDVNKIIPVRLVQIEDCEVVGERLV